MAEPELSIVATALNLLLGIQPEIWPHLREGRHEGKKGEVEMEGREGNIPEIFQLKKNSPAACHVFCWVHSITSFNSHHSLVRKMF